MVLSTAEKALLTACGLCVLSFVLCIPAWVEDWDNVVLKWHTDNVNTHLKWYPQVHAMVTGIAGFCAVRTKHMFLNAAVAVLCVVGMGVGTLAFASASLPFAMLMCCCSRTWCVISESHASFFRLEQCGAPSHRCSETQWRIVLYWVAQALMLVSLSLVLSAAYFFRGEIKSRQAEFSFFVQQSHAGRGGSQAVGDDRFEDGADGGGRARPIGGDRGSRGGDKVGRALGSRFQTLRGGGRAAAGASYAQVPPDPPADNTTGIEMGDVALDELRGPGLTARVARGQGQ